MLPAQVSHFVQFHGIAATHKQLYMGGYALGVRRMNFSLCAGVGSGVDNQYLSPDKMNNNKAQSEIRSSQVVIPDDPPSNSYLERCNSTYNIKQARLGFTIFIRRNDTLGRQPFTGPHLGAEFIYAQTHEEQSVTYKSNADETRYFYSGVQDFTEIGASSHIGWQFAFFHAHLFVDIRAVMPFYYPFISTEPNVNSPFIGNKWEAQVVLSWHFMKNKEKPGDETGPKVRSHL